MRVRLTRKLARELNGVDLSNHEVGDVVDLPDGKGRMLVAEEWAVQERRFPGPLRLLAFRRSTDLGHRDDEDDVAFASQRR